MNEYMSVSNYTKKEAEQSLSMLKSISKSAMKELLFDAKNRGYDETEVNLNIEKVISREDVIINGLHNRVSLNKIRNIGNWEKGFDAGYPHIGNVEKLLGKMAK